MLINENELLESIRFQAVYLKGCASDTNFHVLLSLRSIVGQFWGMDSNEFKEFNILIQLNMLEKR